MTTREDAKNMITTTMHRISMNIESVKKSQAEWIDLHNNNLKEALGKEALSQFILDCLKDKLASLENQKQYVLNMSTQFFQDLAEDEQALSEIEEKILKLEQNEC